MASDTLDKLGKPELVRAVLSQIRDRGPIPFVEFMEMALYTPGLGYYTSPGVKIGAQGDFYTSPDLHPLFGEMMARQIEAVAREIAEQSLVILETGAGKGLLCRDILNALRSTYPALYRQVSYLIVEKSQWMVEQQSEYLSSFTQDGVIRWMEELGPGAFPEGLRGFVLSNELLDSFPVHRLVMKDGALKEVYVTGTEDGFSEILDRPSSPDLLLYFEGLDIKLEEGQQVEVNLKALEWVRRVGRLLKKGIVLTMDYGYPSKELYSPRRKEGTFLCYYRHRVSENPYLRIGRQDMTSHVDFTSLARCGREVGLEVTGFTDQQYFLIGLGITQAIEARLACCADEAEREKDLAAMRHLISPAGMGKVFRILVQHKGLQAPKLEGLTYRPFPQDALFL